MYLFKNTFQFILLSFDRLSIQGLRKKNTVNWFSVCDCVASVHLTNSQKPPGLFFPYQVLYHLFSFHVFLSSLPPPPQWVSESTMMVRAGCL